MTTIGLPAPCVATEHSNRSSTVTGFDTVCAARVFHKLMKRLGFKKFYAQGGDWGSLITTNMAQLEPRYDLTVVVVISLKWTPEVIIFSCLFQTPSTVTGLHVNMAAPSKFGVSLISSILLGRRFPKLFGFTDVDVQRLYPATQKMLVETLKESGYMHIQATKPDTVGTDLDPALGF